MVDITERKRAERALRRASGSPDAFKREREASATTPDAGRHEEHVPPSRVPRSSDAAHLDPRIGVDPRAIEARPASRGRTRHGGQDRGQREEAGAPGLPPARSRPTPARDHLAEAARDRSGGLRPTRRPGDGTRKGVLSRSTVADGRASRSTRQKTKRTPGEPAVQQPPTHAGPVAEDLGACVAALEGRRVCSSSKTTARGVPPDLREAIFEPFRQAPGSSSATPAPASASVCPSCDASPSCTAATHGPRNARAVEATLPRLPARVLTGTDRVTAPR